MLYYLAWDVPPHGVQCHFESYIKNITNSNDQFKELPIFTSKQKRILQIYVFLGLQMTSFSPRNLAHYIPSHLQNVVGAEVFLFSENNQLFSLTATEGQ